MSIEGVGIFLWLAVFNYGEPILDTTKFERTFWTFNTIEECIEYGDKSDFIVNYLSTKTDKVFGGQGGSIIHIADSIDRSKKIRR